MRAFTPSSKYIVTAFAIFCCLAAGTGTRALAQAPDRADQSAPQTVNESQADEITRLFAKLKEADGYDVTRLESEINMAFSRSGSDAMDMLLQRGEAAMAAGDMATAVDHFTALVDHAPEFSAGYASRAAAYFNLGLLGPAVADLRMALALEPRNFWAMSGLSVILEETGDPEGARAVSEAIDAIHPNFEGLQETLERLGAPQGVTL
ncbi:Tetratricopeptide repeat protein [Aquimixticola soesokkakensis]|uniref:Tetratricopeptide repeat protein n=1 Tax=Aquimixticola soesokkakensis TaxID=1519096 RepID=A0A1Y5SEQ2_9RHOB|nr:hypothetical protein [Aquimixticola soesokkakensis]SLN35983.1 Tetratricopeptide repeat protein [Aquimixticola soesokkakensis]